MPRLVRCLFAEIDERRATIGHSDQHESATAYITGVSVRHRQREANSHSGINSIAAGSQDGQANIGGKFFLRDYHRLASDGLASWGLRCREHCRQK